MDGQDKCSRRFVMNLEENRYEMCESDGGECVRKAWCDNDDGDGDDGDGDDGGGGNNNGANPSSADPVYVSNHNAPQCPEENGGNCPGRRSSGVGTAYPGESRTNYRGNVCYYQYGGIGAKCSDIDKKEKLKESKESLKSTLAMVDDHSNIIELINWYFRQRREWGT